jgi:hypothetical protein
LKAKEGKKLETKEARKKSESKESQKAKERGAIKNNKSRPL